MVGNGIPPNWVDSPDNNGARFLGTVGSLAIEVSAIARVCGIFHRIQIRTCVAGRLHNGHTSLHGLNNDGSYGGDPLDGENGKYGIYWVSRPAAFSCSSARKFFSGRDIYDITRTHYATHAYHGE